MDKLDSSALVIDVPAYAVRIADFIAETERELSRDGVVVPISGGLDSSVVAALAVRAVGKDSVTGLFLPEKQGNPEAGRYASLIVDALGIETHTIDISAALEGLGAYDFALSKMPGRRLKAGLVRSFSGRHNQILALHSGRQSRFARRGAASFLIKQRVRLVAIYKYAEERNLLVCGSAHKSEDLVGLYVKFGVDDMADVMPLRNLFRSQIVQLGEHLRLPDAILERSPNPDVIPGVTDKYRDMLGLDSIKVDLVLLGLERRMTNEEIAGQIKIPEQKVAEIAELVRVTEHMRSPSMAPVF
jgi:NAD+ synthase